MERSELTSAITMTSSYLVLLLLISSFTLGYSAQVCPDGSEPVQSYFQYNILLQGFKNDCSKRELDRIDDMVDDVVQSVEEIYPFLSGVAELVVKDCGRTEFVEDDTGRRGLRLEHTSGSIHRKLGRWTRTGGGYCRNCLSSRRGLKQDKELTELQTIEGELETVLEEEQQIVSQNEMSKELIAWLKGFEDYMEVQVKEAIDAYPKRCVTGVSTVSVTVDVLQSENDLPC